MIQCIFVARMADRTLRCNPGVQEYATSGAENDDINDINAKLMHEVTDIIKRKKRTVLCEKVSVSRLVEQRDNLDI